MHMHFHDFFLSFSRYRNNFIFHKYVREKMHSKLECFVRKDFIPLCLLTQIIAAILHKKLAFETRSNLTLHFSQAQCTHTQRGEINSEGAFLYLCKFSGFFFDFHVYFLSRNKRLLFFNNLVKIGA